MPNRNLEDWARIAEIAGAFSIVVSLVYVALELSESNRILQVSSRQALSEQDLRFYETAIDPQVIARAENKRRLGEALSPLEESQLTQRQGLNFRIFEHAYSLYRNDAIDDREWERYRRIIRNNICGNPYAQAMWSNAGMGWDPTFKEIVDSEAKLCGE